MRWCGLRTAAAQQASPPELVLQPASAPFIALPLLASNVSAVKQTPAPATTTRSTWATPLLTGGTKNLLKAARDKENASPNAQFSPWVTPTMPSTGGKGATKGAARSSSMRRARGPSQLRFALSNLGNAASPATAAAAVSATSARRQLPGRSKRRHAAEAVASPLNPLDADEFVSELRSVMSDINALQHKITLHQKSEE